MRIFFMIALLLVSTGSWAQLTIFACEPEWAALSAALAGERADIFTATTALQDPHHVEARPSLIARMRRADLLVCSGAELESGWLPLLLRSSANPRVQMNAPGYFEAALQVQRLGVISQPDRSQGHVRAIRMCILIHGACWQSPKRSAGACRRSIRSSVNITSNAGCSGKCNGNSICNAGNCSAQHCKANRSWCTTTTGITCWTGCH